MTIDIRNYIKDNFKGSDNDEIRASIESSIKEQDEITLPGMGVFFEILWQNSNEDNRNYILNTLNDNLK